VYENAKPNIEKIIELVKLCPDSLQEKCFELLLSAYLESLKPKISPVAPAVPAATMPLSPATPATAVQSGNFGVPDSIKPRLTSLAGRKKVPLERAANLFDFTADPITYHAYVIPGTRKSEKTRNVALSLALKSYVLNGTWMADWKEFRAACVDQNCLDLPNMASIMAHDWFKSVDKNDGISLSSQGVTAAEAQFANMAGGATE